MLYNVFKHQTHEVAPPQSPAPHITIAGLSHEAGPRLDTKLLFFRQGFAPRPEGL